nr:transmembrane protein 266-like [Paramormyrops kingsleyae]
MINAEASQQAGLSELEVISQPVEEENQCMAPLQLVSFAYRDLPLAALDLSLAGSQLLSNVDEEDAREGSNWLKPCCGRRVALWQVCVLSAGFNCFLVACVILVVLFLALELLIDTKLLQFANASQFASIIHWISLGILSIFFTETVFRIVVLGIWDYIENKVEVFDGAVIVLSLAPMVASTVANGPSSPWDAISLIITLRIWRVKRIIDAYVLQVKVEMELEIQQYEKAKAVREDHLERLTQICQEQAVSHAPFTPIGDLGTVEGNQSACRKPHNDTGKACKLQTQRLDPWCHKLNLPLFSEAVSRDDMNNYIRQYYSEPSSDVDIPEAGAHIITTTAIDVHLPNNPRHLSSGLLSVDPQHTGASASDASSTVCRSSCSISTANPCSSSQTLASTTDCITQEASVDGGPPERTAPSPFSSPFPLGRQRYDPSAVVQELLSSLSEDSCLAQKGLDPLNLKLPSPAGSAETSPELEHRVNIYNKRNQEGLSTFQTKPVIHLQARKASLEEKYRFLGPVNAPLSQLPDA